MDADPALEELLHVSEDVRAVVVFERGGEVFASSLPEDDDAAEVAGIADAMLAYADRLRPDLTAVRLEVSTREADVYVVASGERATVAIADPGSTRPLVQHDLRTLLAGEYALA